MDKSLNIKSKNYSKNSRHPFFMLKECQFLIFPVDYNLILETLQKTLKHKFKNIHSLLSILSKSRFLVAIG